MMQQAEGIEASSDNEAIMDALMSRVQARANRAAFGAFGPIVAASASLLSGPTNSALADALVQQELQHRLVLPNPNLGTNAQSELLQSLLLQQALSERQQAATRFAPSNMLGGIGERFSLNNATSLHSRDSLSNNILAQLLLQQQQQQQMVQSALAGFLPTVPDIVPTTVPEKRKGRTGTFPQKLYQMLMDLENEECGTNIASFLPHGYAFAIHRPTEFTQT